MTDKERIANIATVMAKKLKSCIDRLEWVWAVALAIRTEL